MDTTFLDQFGSINDAQSLEVARRIEAGASAHLVGDEVGLSPVGMVAALARLGLGADGSEGLPLIQAQPVRPRLAEVLATGTTLDDLFPQAGRPARLALTAGLLQVLDSWDASHTAAQEADDLGETATAAAWHMIAHRREPDAGNARYWARRVNPRITLPPPAPLVVALLQDSLLGAGWADRLIEELTPVWNPVSMIDLCVRAEPGTAVATLARRFQRLEMLVLLGQSTALGG